MTTTSALTRPLSPAAYATERTPIHDETWLRVTLDDAFADLRDTWEPEPVEGVGTGAGEGAPRQDAGSAWVTRSADCPEAPAQARSLDVCGTCEAAGDEPCRTRSGRVAKAWHAGRRA